jgi:hypothetical protein
MSAREIIEKIEALPPEEKAAVFDYVHHAETTAVQKSEDLAAGVNPVIRKNADKIFDRYDDMFRKLAK